MPKGLITSNISNMYEVEDIENKNTIKCIPRGKFKKDDITPVVGDYVEFEYQKDETGVISQILERKNYIKRPKMANITQLIFVISMKMPKPDLLLLDKQLAFAEYNKIKSVIVLNKIDLEDTENIDEIEKIYKKIGYKVIKTNAKTGEGVEELYKCLKNNVTAFSGNSGVGKSTLINNIFEDVLTSEGEISSKNKRGKNTTTSIKLYKINDNSYIADTPGFSTFDIYEIEKEELSHYFIDLSKYIKDCKFVGCTHIKEDECGIKKALENGKINLHRYETYCKLYNELKEKEQYKW
ncbi:MAG: ribosome small subunit-dependent GTPase A [Clostridia bacterium]|nr:ribosome small subunit-dependent GTPase A [Clostridia bacterium]